MKKIVSMLLVLALFLCACGGDSESSMPGASFGSSDLWSVQRLVDDFGDVIENSKPVIQTPISGEFSNTATSGSDLAGYVFMIMRDGYPTFFIRLLEYGDHQATYTDYDVLEFKIKIGKTTIEFHPVLGTPPNGELMIYDSTETLYTALYNGEDVRCIARIGSSKYSFTLYGDNFADVCHETGYITRELYFSKTDTETIYNRAKELIAEENYVEAIAFLEHLGDYEDSRELLLETACNAYYYRESGDTYKIANNTWRQFFDKSTATPLTDAEIREIIAGDWRTIDGDTYSTYTESGEYIYTMAGQPDDAPSKWYVEDGKLVVQRKYTSSKYTIYPFYKNAYVFRAHQSSSDVYELRFLNGPLE